MNWIWAALGFGLLAALFVSIWGGWGGRPERVRNYGKDGVERGERNLGANINPSQTGNQVNLWPDRTGPQTRRELGAKDTRDMTFTGDREEHKGRTQPSPTLETSKTRPSREVQAGPHVNGPTGGAGSGLKPEDEFGENRPAIRNTAPDGQPAQWHPDQHGVPGDHIREGHHRSASAPEKHSTATDPYAHAPVPGPNHIPTPEGQNFPPEVRP